jgi:hypothetical protein
MSFLPVSYLLLVYFQPFSYLINYFPQPSLIYPILVTTYSPLHTIIFLSNL